MNFESFYENITIFFLIFSFLLNIKVLKNIQTYLTLTELKRKVKLRQIINNKRLCRFSIIFRIPLNTAKFCKLCEDWSLHFQIKTLLVDSKNHCMKSVLSQSFSGPYFPAFGLNTERYCPNSGKYRPKNSEYGHFSRSD